jgi:hypothetical protein
LANTRPDGVVGFADEAWWSRLARPALPAWREDAPLRLVEQTVAKDDPDPKALACDGLLLRDGLRPETVWLRFGEGRPVSTVTTAFRAWCAERLAATGAATPLLVWDNASWHVSGAVRTWLRAHTPRAHREGSVRIVPCFLPHKSPWLNPIEPKWVPGKRRSVEPARLLTAAEWADRVCAALGCPHCEHLAIPHEVA